MIFKTRYYLKDREGEEKIVRKFSLLPRSFDDDKERVWLETVDIVYRIKKIDVGGTDGWGSYAWKWVPIRFATDKDRQELPFEVKNSDIYDLIERKFKSPNFWLGLDTIALASAFFDVRTSITMFIAIKCVQFLNYLSEVRDRDRRED